MEDAVRGAAAEDAVAWPTAPVADDIFSRIAALEPGLSRANRTIARAVLERPRDFIEKPLDALLAWLGVSAPTLTRFARLCGCEGLRDLKLKVMGGLRVGLRYFEPDTEPADAAELVSRCVHRAQHAIASAVQTLDLGAIGRAAEIVGSARRLYAFGGGGVSNWLVQEVQNRLFRLGIAVIPCIDHQMQLMLAATMGPRDCLLCCSLGGRNPELLKAASVAQEYGAPTLALTAQDTPLAGAVAVPLTISVSDDGDVLGPTAIRYGQLIALDVLAYTLALRGGAPARDMLRRVKQQLIAHRALDQRQPLSD